MLPKHLSPKSYIFLSVVLSICLSSWRGRNRTFGLLLIRQLLITTELRAIGFHHASIAKRLQGACKAFVKVYAQWDRRDLNPHRAD